MTTHTETQSVAESLGGRAERQLRQMGGLSYYGDGDAQLDKQAAALLTRQQEDIERLTEALRPFSDFAAATVDEGGWTGRGQFQQIGEWFAPSDFRAALQAKPETTACDSEDPTEMCMHCHCWKFTRSTCK